MCMRRLSLSFGLGMAFLSMEERPMNREKKLRISQCMIVKNEEQTNEIALSRGRDVIRERV